VPWIGAATVEDEGICCMVGAAEGVMVRPGPVQWYPRPQAGYRKEFIETTLQEHFARLITRRAHSRKSWGYFAPKFCTGKAVCFQRRDFRENILRDPNVGYPTQGRRSGFSSALAPEPTFA
jgi:hypothetical protein